MWLPVLFTVVYRCYRLPLRFVALLPLPLSLRQVDLSKSESRILRIARGSGTHPDEVRGLLKMHKHFEKVFGKVGKNIKGETSKVKQLQVKKKKIQNKKICLIWSGGCRAVAHRKGEGGGGRAGGRVGVLS